MLKQESGFLKKASVTVVAPNSSCAQFCKQNERISCNADIDMSLDVRNARDSVIDLVSVTMDGEIHWVSGVDANTTCTDLICALLNYKDLEGQSNGHLPIYSTLSNNKSGRSIHTSSQNTMHKATTITNTKENEQTSYSKGLNTNLHQYVIVKQLRDSRFEEYLDGSTRLMDVIPIGDKLTKNQCELQLRNLAVDTSARISNTLQNQMFSMLSMSTDKDSGMGSPVGSARSERYRRRRGKAHRMGITEGPALPKHTKPLQLQSCNLNPNEHLMNIILAQDETIKKQIYLLNQKEQQILKIEEEKHRARALKLGKNYLIDTYLNALGKAPDKELDRTDLDDQWECATSSNKLNMPHPACIHEVDAKQPADPVSNIPIDAHIYWLEKVYNLNVRLQREEEELLRLHAKVRKHQMRHAYHTKDEVLQQIDRLDTSLANQVNDIYRIERQLLMANEQLKAKLGVLESLGNELEVMPAVDPEMPVETTTALTVKLNEDLIAHRKSLAEHLIQNLQEKEGRQNYIKNLIKNDANGRDQTDAKMLKKQLFFTVDNSATLDQEEKQSMTNYNESNRILGYIEADIDIENFGTLV